VLVISIIGPQSSGKSTLLNYLFGSTFASATGLLKFFDNY